LRSTSRLPRLHFSRITISRNASFRFRVFGSQCLPTASSFSHESPVTSHQSLLWNKLPFQCFPQFCSTRAELVIVHTMAFRRTLIRSELSAWTCQPFCCQRAFTLIPSGPQLSAEIFQIAPENKKPGVERRAQSPFSGVFARSSTIFYPVLVKNLTIGSTSGLRLILRWEEPSLRPDCDAPENSLVYPQAVNKYTQFSEFVKPSAQEF